jgi:hypothetical protein
MDKKVDYTLLVKANMKTEIDSKLTIEKSKVD